MEKKYFDLLFLLFLITAFSSSFADELQLLDVDQEYVAGKHVEWFSDPTFNITMDDLLHERNGVWKPSNVDIPNLGFRDEVIWYKASFVNVSEDLSWYFVVDCPMIRSLDVFLVKNNKIFSAFSVGDRYQFSARPFPHRNFVFPIDIPKGEHITLYLRMEGPYVFQLPAYFMTESTFIKKDVKHSLSHGLFFGFILVMALYNFFLFVSTREFAYLYYVFFTLSVGGFQFSREGFGFQFIWPDEIWMQNKAIAIFLHLSIVSCFLFVSRFLYLKEMSVLLYKALLMLALVAFFMLVALPFLDDLLVLRIGSVLTIPVLVLVVVSGVVGWCQGSKEAQIFAVAWGVFCVGSVLLALNKLGLIERNFYSEHGAEVGTVIELTLLAFALANRINLEKARRVELQEEARQLNRRALQAKEHALELEKINNEQLEFRVQERTRELYRALSDMSEMNRRMEEMNFLDSVTGVDNENSFLLSLNKEWDRAFRESSMLAMISIELDGYRTIVAEYGQVAADECLKNTAAIIQRVVSRPADLVARYGDKMFGVLLPVTDEQGAYYIAEKIAAMIHAQPFDVGVVSITASVSVGVSCARPIKLGMSKDFLKQVESAVYIVQSRGGKGVEKVMMNS